MTRDETMQVGGYLRMRRRRKWLAPIALSMTPMIDVVFLLLVYFVLVARFGAGEGALGMEMERGAAAAAGAGEAVWVEVIAEGSGYRVLSDGVGLDGAVGIEEMIGALKAGIERERVVTIAPGAGTSWEQALDAYAKVRGAGFTETRLGVEDEASR